MSHAKRITTRELLRNFKSLKDQLLTGSVHHLVIDIGNEQELELSMRKKSNTGENLAHAIQAMKKPITVKRIDVFDELLP